MNCLVCEASGIDRLYTTGGNVSITSLSVPLDGPTTVFFCPRCGHLQTEALPEIERYYDEHYNINLADDQEPDQLYAVVEGRPVFRNDHQSRAVLSRIDLPREARVLDYGCGAGQTARAVASLRPDLSMHLFDVSENYKPAWGRWLDDSRMACYDVPASWGGSFDLVTSFFALEHVNAPRRFADTLFNLLKPGGRAYLVVPNAYQNVADFIVVDHVNHFSDASLCRLLAEAGFEVQSISAEDHDSAWTVVARRPLEDEQAREGPTPASLQAIAERAHEMGRFWTQSESRIAAFEAETRALPATIYGSGFYGCYLYTRLTDPGRVQGFVDRNPHQHDKTLFGRTIRDPLALEAQPQAVWVGLNPRIARVAIADLSAWQGRAYTYFYL